MSRLGSKAGPSPSDDRWRYDRYLNETGRAAPLGPDEWYRKAQVAWENNSAGNGFEEAARARLNAPLGAGSKPVSIEGHVPDLPVNEKFGVTDIKNRLDLADSPQLRAFHRYAADNDLPFNIIIGPRTQSISEPLLDNIRATGGSVIQYDPSTNQFTNISIGQSGPWHRGRP